MIIIVQVGLWRVYACLASTLGGKEVISVDPRVKRKNFKADR